MGDLVKEEFPGMYCVPGDMELSKVVSNVIKREAERSKEQKVDEEEGLIDEASRCGPS
jgi:hypothetical protein